MQPTHLGALRLAALGTSLALQLAAVALPISACDAKLQAARDRDGDGYEARALGGDDCDDDNASVSPLADEICGDHIDNNCDGAVDDRGAGDQLYWRDADGDGWGTPTETLRACSLPALGWSDDDGDCDDEDAGVHPRATEHPGDGVDSNCDASDDPR